MKILNFYNFIKTAKFNLYLSRFIQKIFLFSHKIFHFYFRMFFISKTIDKQPSACYVMSNNAINITHVKLLSACFILILQCNSQSRFPPSFHVRFIPFVIILCLINIDEHKILYEYLWCLKPTVSLINIKFLRLVGGKNLYILIWETSEIHC